MSALSSRKIDRYTGEEMLPSNRSQIIGKLEQRKFKYSHLGKA